MALFVPSYVAPRHAGFVVREDRPDGGYTPRHPHDRGYKHLLSGKAIFLELLRSFVRRGWVSHIDESQLVRVDKSYILPDFRSKEADIVYRMKLNGHEVVFYVLLELQSTVDALMPWRLLLYQVEIWRQALADRVQRGEGRPRLPVVVPIVLYNGSAPWTAPLSFRELLAGEERFDGEALVNFSYVLLDVHRYTQDDLEQLANVVGSVFLIDRNRHGSMEGMLEQFRRLAPTIDALPEEQRGLFAVWLEHTLRRLAKAGSDEEKRVRDIVMEIQREGMIPMTSNFVQSIDRMVEQWEENGVRKGLEQGKEQAMEAVARGLLAKGMDVAFISDITALPETKISQLRKRLNG